MPIKIQPTLFWEKLVVGAIIYLAIGSFFAGAGTAVFENECPHSKLPPDHGLFIMTWLPAGVGYAIVRNKAEEKLSCPTKQ